MSEKKTKEYIKVKESRCDDISTITSAIYSIISEVYGFRETNGKITQLLADGGWEGKSYENFVSAHSYMVEYSEYVIERYDELKEEINNLILAVDEFADNSAAVKCLEE